MNKYEESFKELSNEEIKELNNLVSMDQNEIPITDSDFESYEKGFEKLGMKILERTETSMLVDVTDLIQKIHETGFKLFDEKE